MRILQVYRTYYPECRGGLLEVMRQIALGANVLGVETRILALTAHPGGQLEQSPPEPEVEWMHLDFEIAGCGFSGQALRRFHELAAWADVVHYHFPWPFADVMHFLGRPNRPSLVTYHSDIVKQERLMMVYRPLMNRYLSSVDAIVATSPSYVATSPVLQQFKEKTRVIPIGIDSASYPSVDPVLLDEWRSRLGDDFLLFIGVVRYYKGLHILLEALRDSPVKLAILGSGPMEADLRSYATAHGMDNVHFLGELSDEHKVVLLQLCQGLLLPSHLRSEAFGVSLLEAFMYGKPAITCEIGTGTSYVNLHEHTGLVVPPNNPAALRAAVDRLMENPGERSVWGNQAKQRYEENFTALTMARQYVRLYRDLADARAQALAIPLISEPTYVPWEGLRSVMVMGATSQIGVFLLPYLVQQGLEVHALSRTPPSREERPGMFWHRMDIKNEQMPEFEVDCLIHLAPLTLLPPILAKLSPGRLKRVIAFGSTSRFSKQNSSDPDERAFALGLAEAEDAIARFCEARGIAWTVFRPTLIYGCGIDRNVSIIAKFIRRFGFFPLIGGAAGLRQPVHAVDLAGACMAVMGNTAAFNKAYDLSGGETLSYREMVERIFAAVGKRPRFLKIPLALYRSAMEVASLVPSYGYLSGEMAARMVEDLCFSHDAAARDFGYAPRLFEPRAIRPPRSLGETTAFAFSDSP